MKRRGLLKIIRFGAAATRVTIAAVLPTINRIRHVGGIVVLDHNGEVICERRLLPPITVGSGDSVIVKYKVE